jgi:hypothetical protein
MSAVDAVGISAGSLYLRIILFLITPHLLV